MKQKKYLTEDIKALFKKELKVNVNIKNKMNDFSEWDSIGNFNILLACEKKFQIKFTPNQFNTLTSFTEIEKIVKKKIKKSK